MNALVTGANGLIGSQLVRTLLDAGHSVRALVRPASDRRSLEGLDLAFALGDILDPASLKTAADGCTAIFHTAGAFAYWGYQPQTFIREAEEGMRNVVQAAEKAGIGRLVFTSSSVTIGATAQKQVLTEARPGAFDDLPAYVQAKIAQENAGFAEGKKTGVEVLAICPTLSIGGPDYGLTESNRILVNYLKDPLKATWIGGCNLVAAPDVAAAMLLLYTRGQAGERYLAGSDNLEWQQVHQWISETCNLPGPYLTAYATASYLTATLYEMVSLFTQQTPATSRDQAKMVGKYYWYDNAKLRALGFSPRSSRQALSEALSWLVASDHVSPALRSTIRIWPQQPE